jgi:hypothetical protein
MDSIGKAPLASIDPNVVVPASAHFDLLSHLQYTPSERDQGSAGNCWVWAGTGVTEVALDVQERIKDRLSIQYFDSNYNGGTGVGSGCSWAGCGGNLNEFAQFYSGSTEAIPWSNTNAAYQDGGQSCPVSGCESSGTAVPAASISTTPNYPVKSVTENAIPYTHGVSQDTVINSIKNILHQNKAIYFAFALPNDVAWNDFGNWWGYQPESASYDLGKYNSVTYDYVTGAGHAVLLVGYDDTNPADRYWIMVNSWGTATNRPNGIFHVKMNMNYDTTLYDPVYAEWFYNLWWETLDLNFRGKATPLAYDDGGAEGSSAMTTPGYYMAVRFSLPGGWPRARVLSARYYLWSAVSFKVHVFGSDGATNLITPLVVDPGNGYEGWFKVDLTSYWIVVPGDFYVAIEYTTGYSPRIGDDSDAPDGRSYYGQPGGWTRFGDWPPPPALDLMIRADVDLIRAWASQPYVLGFKVSGVYSDSAVGDYSVSTTGWSSTPASFEVTLAEGESLFLIGASQVWNDYASVGSSIAICRDGNVRVSGDMFAAGATITNRELATAIAVDTPGLAGEYTYSLSAKTD